MNNHTSPSGKPPLIQEHQRAIFLPDVRAKSIKPTSNPTPINSPFWKHMVRHGNWAYDVRKELNLWPTEKKDGPEPIFCFHRMGRTVTELPDGRVIFIGGEHEDFYDPDFYIYNDVVVVRLGGTEAALGAEEEAGSDSDSDWPSVMSDSAKESWRREVAREKADMKAFEKEEDLRIAMLDAGADPANIDIYGYPTDVFPGTDFHTATYVKHEGGPGGGGEYIYIIGGLGYRDSPHRAGTLVHRLDLGDFSIRRVGTSGEAPPARDGSENDRKAELRGERVVYTVGAEEYVLSLADMRWSRGEA